MISTSFISVPTEELRTACELWFDRRNEIIKNKTQKALEDAMMQDTNSWIKKKFHKTPKYRTKEEAIEFINESVGYLYSIVQRIECSGLENAQQVEKLLSACKSPNDGFVYLSVEDNFIVEGYYQ